MFRRYAQFGFLALACVVFSAGCETKPTAPAGEEPSASDGHAGHHHADEGPRGGHLLHLEPGGVHAEWKHDDAAKSVTVYLDDLEGAKVKSVNFVVKVGDAAPQEFALTAADKVWSLTSETLLEHLNAGETEISLVIKTEDGPMTTPIEHEAHQH
jgi:hypothetical protein